MVNSKIGIFIPPKLPVVELSDVTLVTDLVVWPEVDVTDGCSNYVCRSDNQFVEVVMDTVATGAKLIKQSLYSRLGLLHVFLKQY